jgi:hypothetical protein
MLDERAINSRARPVPSVVDGDDVVVGGRARIRARTDALRGNSTQAFE